MWEQTFQGILLSPHNVNQRVLQRMHAETIKGSRSLLQKEEKTTISVLNSCEHHLGTTQDLRGLKKSAQPPTAVFKKRKAANCPREILSECTQEMGPTFSFCLVAHDWNIMKELEI